MPSSGDPRGNPNYQAVLWDGSKPYWLTDTGNKIYIPPASAVNAADPRLKAWGQQMSGGSNPTAGDFSSAPSTWNQETGQFDGGNFFDSSLGGLVVGGGATGGLATLGAVGATPAVAPGAAGSEGDAAALAGADATSTALPSTTIGSGAITGAPSSVPSGAMSTATSTGLPDWLKSASDIGSAIGAAGTGAAAGRNADNVANIGFANAQNGLYNSELAAPGKIAGNAVRGDILSNARDVSIAAPSDIPVPTISGGPRPSMFSDTTRQLGKNITANAAATPMPVATAPVLQPMETAGLGSDLLNTAGVIGSLAKTIPPSFYGKIAGLF